MSLNFVVRRYDFFMYFHIFEFTIVYILVCLSFFWTISLGHSRSFFILFTFFLETRRQTSRNKYGWPARPKRNLQKRKRLNPPYLFLRSWISCNVLYFPYISVFIYIYISILYICLSINIPRLTTSARLPNSYHKKI